METNKEIPTAEEIAKKYKSNTDHYADQDYYEEDVVKAMKEYCKLKLPKHAEVIFKRVSKDFNAADFDLEMSISQASEEYINNLK